LNALPSGQRRPDGRRRAQLQLVGNPRGATSFASAAGVLSTGRQAFEHTLPTLSEWIAAHSGE
jgi:hypothetical protein